MGASALEPVGADSNGAMDPEALAAALGRGAGRPTIVCAQAGNVNTGACDDLAATTAHAREHGAWVHVDGAFGLWAAASPGKARPGGRHRDGSVLGGRRAQMAQRHL
jgi:glutamate/tyrosine decarboxylase-like PLP-dependent enzyme